MLGLETFNQFFYRKLKESARPVDNPDDPTILVSGADCRMMAFETVNEATQLWIKGREFTVSRLLGERYKDQAPKYTGGALGIFRLAPQDYHRFHSPVDGTIGPMTYVSGEYYTVNVCPLNIFHFQEHDICIASAPSNPHQVWTKSYFLRFVLTIVVAWTFTAKMPVKLFPLTAQSLGEFSPCA